MVEHSPEEPTKTPNAARASSVFLTPPKQALVAPSYAEAVTVARQVFGQGISRQA